MKINKLAKYLALLLAFSMQDGVSRKNGSQKLKPANESARIAGQKQENPVAANQNGPAFAGHHSTNRDVAYRQTSTKNSSSLGKHFHNKMFKSLRKILIEAFAYDDPSNGAKILCTKRENSFLGKAESHLSSTQKTLALAITTNDTNKISDVTKSIPNHTNKTGELSAILSVGIYAISCNVLDPAEWEKLLEAIRHKMGDAAFYVACTKILEHLVIDSHKMLKHHQNKIKDLEEKAQKLADSYGLGTVIQDTKTAKHLKQTNK